MDPLEAKTLETIRRHSLIAEGGRVIAAVSGGPDSTALLLALLASKDVLGFDLEAMHVNHQLRGRESEGDEAFVRELCRRNQVKLTVHRSLPPTQGNLEREVRDLRYDALSDLATRRRAVLATGHSMDDQAETLLMKLVRGAGPTGLSAIFPKRDGWGENKKITIVRPVLESSRDEILAYLNRRGQPFRTDSTNQNLDLDRNWVRNELIPSLALRLNPRVVPALARAASLSLEISEYLQQQAQEALDSCLAPDDEVVLDIPKLTVYPAVLQKEILRLALTRAKGDLDRIEFVHLNSALSLCQGRSGQSTSLPGGWRVEREFETLRLTDRPLVPDFEKEVTVPGQVFVKELDRTVQIHQGVFPNDDGILIRCGTDSLLLRNWRPGDRFLLQPGRRRRLKRIFQERKVPRAERTSRMILAWRDELVWVQGIGVAAGFSQIQPGESCLKVKVL